MMFNMVQALNQAMAQEMEKDPRVLVLGEDIGVDGGVFRLTEGLLEKFGPERVIDTPLAESAIVGTSIGMATAGLRPIAEIQFMGFIYLAMNQIISHAARLRNRSRGRFTVPMVIRMPYGAGVRSLEHHSESTEALFCQIPGLKVVVPSTPYDAKGLLIASIRDEDPVIFLEPTRLYRAGRQEVAEELYEIPLGQARIVREGEGLTIVAWGAMIPVVEQAAESVGKDGIFPEVVDLRTLAPLDRKTVIESVKRTGRLLVVHEAPKTCGLGAEIAAFVAAKAMLNLEAPILRVTGQDITVPLAKGEDYYYPSPERVAWGIKKIMEF
ncbi:MAG: 2-oxoisovalerate dehydrogenase [Candidatus Aminicenantes bacterium RBG_13_59_9]|jgi:pyruvate dehydrogenase E1 component beta subunit|nr:MAG: 2-oxoisovalerate dehydrogenase [Candidatus Aminicenantes bacterium RBG_13_59_9]